MLLSMIFSCKKEHLQPDPPPGSTEPLVYIAAKLNDDSVYFAAGVDSYVGSTSVFDTLHYRAFSFTLKTPNDSLRSYFKISINNYTDTLGVLQDDLDHSIYVDLRHYQFPHNINHFTTLAITVNWIDSAGKTFSSDVVEQPDLFSITAVEDVIFEGKDYKQVSVEFDCTLDHEGTTLHLTNGKATLLFGTN